MRRIGIKDEVIHAPPRNSENAAGNLIGAPEVPFEHKLATACDQNRVHVSSVREPISHPAQRVAVDELIVIDGSDGPTVVSRDRKTAAVGRVRVNRQRCEWRQRSSPDKRNKLAPPHAILSSTPSRGAQKYLIILSGAIAKAQTRIPPRPASVT